jgi:hypothetical protein
MNSNKEAHIFCKTTPTVKCTSPLPQTTILYTIYVGIKYDTANDNSLQLVFQLIKSVHGKIRTKMKQDCAEKSGTYVGAEACWFGLL